MTTLIKLGGSLVTDKRKAKSFRRELVRDIARQLSDLRAIQPDERIILGHGSGSFGHFEAKKYNTIEGVRSANDRFGFAKVGAVATELSLLILGELLAAGLPVLRIQPSSILTTRNGQIENLHMRALVLALGQGLMPLVHGDVAIDDAIGGTIVSTETLFAELVEPLDAHAIVLLGEVDGVLDQNGEAISEISPTNVHEYAPLLGASDGLDVTGGMYQKVHAMLRLAQANAKLKIIIANGNRKNVLPDLLHRGIQIGTKITAT